MIHQLDIGHILYCAQTQSGRITENNVYQILKETKPTITKDRYDDLKHRIPDYFRSQVDGIIKLLATLIGLSVGISVYLMITAKENENNKALLHEHGCLLIIVPFVLLIIAYIIHIKNNYKKSIFISALSRYAEEEQLE